VRERPAEDGAVSADTDNVTLVRTDLKACDRSAVTASNVRHRSFLVQPYLHHQHRHHHHHLAIVIHQYSQLFTSVAYAITDLAPF